MATRGLRSMVVMATAAVVAMAACGSEEDRPPPAAPAETATPPAPAPAPPQPAAEPAPSPPTAPAEPAPAAVGEHAATLDAMNELCGDTWCEGEFDFRFTALTCAAANRCSLSFTARHYEDPEDRPLREASVELTGFAAPTAEDGEPTEAFFEAVGTALGRWERTAR